MSKSKRSFLRNSTVSSHASSSWPRFGTKSGGNAVTPARRGLRRRGRHVFARSAVLRHGRAMDHERARVADAIDGLRVRLGLNDGRAYAQRVVATERGDP